jgi:hypothetical protein
MFCIISMQIGVYDVFAIKFSRFTCYDTVSYYDIIPSLTSLIGAPYQIFANIACMILLMILSL